MSGLQSFESQFGPTLGKATYFPYIDWSDTLSTWQEYKALFHSEGRVNLLNAVAPHAVATIQKALVQSVVFGICRLTDPPVSQGKKNASVQALREFCNEPNLVELEQKINFAVSASVNVKTLRNKLLAHNDLATQESAFLGPIPSISESDVIGSLDAVYEVFRYIYYVVCDSDLQNEVVTRKDSHALLIALFDGHHAAKHRKEMVSDGAILPRTRLSDVDSFQA